VWLTPGENIGERLERICFYLAFASAASILISIALSQFLLGMAIVCLLAAREKLRFPPLKLPLAFFFSTTLISLLLCADPRHGLSQIRKFFVFAILLVIFSTFRTIESTRLLVLTWTGLASCSALYSFTQFLHRVHQAQLERPNYYGYFLDARITGFASHWMTFGGEQMIVLLMLLSYLFFWPGRRWKTLGLVGLALLWGSTLLGLTRSIFLLGTPIGALYLIWNWKKRMLIAVPVLALLIALCAPFELRERIKSVFQPHPDWDSNQRHLIMARTGWEMIKAHPWFGVGPEQVSVQFLNYVPKDIPRPLPKGWYGHLHNVYLQYAAERGIPALIAILWLIGKALYDFRRALRTGKQNGQARFVLHGAVASILAVLAEAFFEHNLGDSEVLTMVLVVIACGYVAVRVLHRSSQERSADSQGKALEFVSYGTIQAESETKSA
jgi:putative inorganic carbon (HCO3(-)) transporter